MSEIMAYIVFTGMIFLVIDRIITAIISGKQLDKIVDKLDKLLKDKGDKK